MTGPPREVTLLHGDCLALLPTLEAGSIDAIITDPPYPEIDRAYGRWTEAEWWDLMMGVCREARRVLKPAGSAVFVLQPNSKKAGSLRGWLWEFMAWACREWNMVQDAWWWNTRAMPLGGATECGLMRPSVRACVWCGPADCWRDQGAVLLGEADAAKSARAVGRFTRENSPARSRSDSEGRRDCGRRLLEVCVGRGGVTPLNVLAYSHGAGQESADGAGGHPASTPRTLCQWWARYICPPRGVVLDPFMGSGTVGVACRREDRRFVGVEIVADYVAIAEKRIDKERGKHPLFAALEEGHP